MLGCMVLSTLPVTVLITRVPSRVRAEKKAGYTTLQYGDRKLEQRDPYMGGVIRTPGKEYLDRSNFRACLKEAKGNADRLIRDPSQSGLHPRQS